VHIPSTTSYKLEEHICEGVDDYIVPDQEYCDRYLSCPNSKVVLCLTNMVLDINTGICREKTAIDCTGRELLFRNVNQEDEQNKKFEEEMKEIMAPFQPSQQVSDDGASEVDIQTSGACVVSRGEYVMADPVYCDRYVTCPEGEVEMCQRGMVLDIVTQLCMVRGKVDCEGRERIYREEVRGVKTKASKDTFENISVSKGNRSPGKDIPSAIPTSTTVATLREESENTHSLKHDVDMSNFVFKTPTRTKTATNHGHSTTMVPSLKSETKLNTDSSPRKVKMMVDIQPSIPVDQLPNRSHEGTITKSPAGPIPTIRRVLDILPTNIKSTTVSPPLPLSDGCGGQDRIPHPSDCKLFYTCHGDGLKTLGSCVKPEVFNSVTGHCEVQESVPGCEGYYSNKVLTLDTTGRDKIVEELREQLIKEFGLGDLFRTDQMVLIKGDQASLVKIMITEVLGRSSS